MIVIKELVEKVGIILRLIINSASALLFISIYLLYSLFLFLFASALSYYYFLYFCSLPLSFLFFLFLTAPTLSYA
jgi:hypothetical protein